MQHIFGLASFSDQQKTSRGNQNGSLRCVGLRGILVAAILLMSTLASADNFCWRDNYGRGVGEPLTICAAGQEKNGALCYPECKEGFNGAGPVCWSICPEGYIDDGVTCRKPGDIQARASYGRTAGQAMVCGEGRTQQAGLCYESCGTDWRGEATVCYQNCPEGFRDDGLYCGKPEPYGRGTGYVAWDLKVCETKHGKGNCETWGAMHYPKCKENYHATGCCVCSPDCPEGWEDIGVSCKKPARDRGVGLAVDTCPPGSERNGALCYPLCKDGYSGAGPVCWSHCPEGYIDDGATCRKDPIIVGKQSYGRTAGEPLICRDDLQQSGAICYPPCGEKEDGIGPVCWGHCPSSMPYDCGAACAVSEGDCVDSIQKMLIQGAKMTIDVITFGGTTALDVDAAMDDAAQALVKGVDGMAIDAGTGAGGQLGSSLGGAAVSSASTTAISGIAGAGARAAVKATLSELLIPFDSLIDLTNMGTYSDVAEWSALLAEAGTKVDGGLSGGHILALMSTQMTPVEHDALISQLALAFLDEQVTDPFDVFAMIPLTNPFGILDFVDTFRKGSCSEYPDTTSPSGGLTPIGIQWGYDPDGLPTANYDPDAFRPVEEYQPVTLSVTLTGGSKPSGRDVMKVAKSTVDTSSIEKALGKDADPALVQGILARFESGKLFEGGTVTTQTRSAKVVAETEPVAPPSGEAMPPTEEGDYRRIQNNWYKDRYVHNQNGPIEVGPIQPNWTSAQWKVLPAHSGWVRIQNRANPDLHLHYEHGSIEVGPIQPNWASALWKLEPAHSGWVRIQNGWYKDRYIHNEHGKIEVSAIQPNWASALWKVE